MERPSLLRSLKRTGTRYAVEREAWISSEGPGTYQCRRPSTLRQPWRLREMSGWTAVQALLSS